MAGSPAAEIKPSGGQDSACEPAIFVPRRRHPRTAAVWRPGSPLRRTIRTNPGRLPAHSAPYAQLTGAVGE
eukprot:843650-Prorocentrum_lima.AAC.1